MDYDLNSKKNKGKLNFLKCKDKIRNNNSKDNNSNV